jgi:hypothetical protein
LSRGLVQVVVVSIAFVGALATSVRAAEAAAADRPLQLAQSIVGQCRQTSRYERIYRDADLASPRISDIVGGTRVTLAGDNNQPAFGWIRISAPFNGYILSTFLVPCNLQPVGDGNAVNNCGIVTVPSLAVRTGPSTLSGYTGRTLLQEQAFRITAAPETQTEPATESGRVWVQIDRPDITGWISETGAQGAGTNFRRVPCESTDLP